MDDRERILTAASRRFADYGYAKTTMAEIARDAQMSAGNLYRHFASKEAIAVAAIERQLATKLEVGIRAAAAEQDPLHALKAFLLARLRQGHAVFAGTRHLFDMMRLMNERHRNLLLAWEKRVIDALAEILERGMVQQRFRSIDAQRTAYDIHQATMRYNHPVALRNNPLSILEADLERLIDLLYTGLKC
ncbi:MAG: TetR/AcrR family transcriptional regulator [Zetaproteobacteria bacterium]|nr:MAG: TetR/AcrR family transcriptional regulator [Zetaproteobacteria bacterium]